MKPRMLLIASLTAVLSAGAFAQSGGGLPPVTDKTPIYGSQIMTQQERLEYRSQMRAAKTLEEREQIRARHHEQMVERAKERGITLPAEPPARGGGMGPGTGMGPGGGMAPGGGMGPRGGMGPGGPNR